VTGLSRGLLAVAMGPGARDPRRLMQGSQSVAHTVCCWWHAYLFDNPLRRLVHRPEAILGPYVRTGMRALDLGCGMGFFTLAMARMVGPRGRVVAVDVQPQMLVVLERRARQAGVLGRIEGRLSQAGRLPLDGRVDFALAFWSLHEMPDVAALARTLREHMPSGTRFFMAEPCWHVQQPEFEQTVRAVEAGPFHVCYRPRIALSRAVVFRAA